MQLDKKCDWLTTSLSTNLFAQVGHLCSDVDETWTQLHEDWGAELFKPVLKVVQTPQDPPDMVPPA